MRRLAIALLVCASSATAHATLTEVTTFGSNPGNLQMFEYVPANLPAGRPLVVVLHGCTQTAAAMESAGWNKLADQYQFAVLYPQQQSANNPVECFNWAGEYGDPADLVRGQGENQSIMSMIDTMHANHSTDNSKVYIAGFSAGAAFVPVMLATWPERFAAGAIMEGIAYRCATSVNEAYSCQSPGVTKTPQAWGDLVRNSYTAFTGTRPRVQIWVGTSDTTVVPANGTELVKQWTNVAGTDQTADETENLGSAATRTAYKMGATTVVEEYTIQGMNHAVSIGAEGATACPGTSGSYFDNKPVCSTIRAAKFFGVMPGGGSGSGSGSGSGAGGNPFVSIVSPSDGESVTGQLTIVVAAGDDAGISSVSLTIDGADAGTDSDAPYQFDWNATTAGAGTHTLVATATDSAGNSSTAMATVTVPGPGGGSGGSGSAGEKDIADLPACSLDAGKSDGRGFAPIAIAIIALVRIGRRRKASR